MKINKFSCLTKIFAAFFLFILVAGISNLQGQESYNLELHFTGLETEGESTILIAVYNKTDNFLGDKPHKAFVAKTNGKSELNYTIELPKGTYAMAVFQDLNGNKILDKNMVGYPKEPFAFSNNAPANFGPPKWKDAVFTIEKPIKMKIDF